MKEYIIDATNKKMGRIASEAAKVLLGKDTTTFAKNIVVPIIVKITNASKADISEKKKGEKIYQRYSGYPGGRTETVMNKVIDRKGYTEVFRHAVSGMLPKNKLRDERMKHLIITE